MIVRRKLCHVQDSGALQSFLSKLVVHSIAHLFVSGGQLAERAAGEEYHAGVLARDGYSDGSHDTR